VSCVKLSEHPPPLPKNASAVAVDVIRQAIAEGRLEPGQRLKEEELARQFGISRTPIREALLVLQAEGLVVAATNRGASVRSYQSHDLEDMYALRALLEAHAAHRAAGMITPLQLQLLHESVKRFVGLQLDEVAELVTENARFHDTILEASQSERLGAMVRQVVPLPMQYRSWMWYSQNQLELSHHYHRKILQALEARDADRAEGLMRAHVLESRDFLVSRLQELEMGTVRNVGW
jgi:DNA-binding GntR family transcriptional regulator